MSAEPITGGCQCGAVRYRIGRLGRPTICHCRMCQKAFGGFFAPLVTAHETEWTRGAPSHFQSSDKVRRGFCAKCGTPLTYEAGDGLEIAIGSLDTPAIAAPVAQVNAAFRQPFFDGLCSLPEVGAADAARNEAWNTALTSFQHPDHDTATWPQETQR
ncbi:GFA family protein [Hoeflea sp.]|uniref:GFA family protein n=1 Tax=Hoeflea sp. TaxID=1940281 RepID=UPI0019C8968D|nr:GFA family protein [Hoeflea sp.]MBC7283512.1 GFA family protein [Hoeflea sp.]